MALITRYPYARVIDSRDWFTAQTAVHHQARAFVLSQLVHDIDMDLENGFDPDDLIPAYRALAYGYALMYRRIRGWAQFGEMDWVYGSFYHNNFGVVLRTWDILDEAVEGDFVWAPDQPMFVPPGVHAIIDGVDADADGVE